MDFLSLMLTNMDVFCDLFLNRQTEKWNRIVLSKRRKELFNHLDQYIWNVNFSDFVNKGDLHWPLNDRWGWTLIVFLFVCLFFYFYFYFYFLILVTVSLPYREKFRKKCFRRHFSIWEEGRFEVNWISQNWRPTLLQYQRERLITRNANYQTVRF